MFFDMSSIHLLKLIRVCPAKEAGVSVGLFVKTNATWVTKTLIILSIKEDRELPQRRSSNPVGLKTESPWVKKADLRRGACLPTENGTRRRGLPVHSQGMFIILRGEVCTHASAHMCTLAHACKHGCAHIYTCKHTRAHSIPLSAPVLRAAAYTHHRRSTQMLKLIRSCFLKLQGLSVVPVSSGIS